MFALHETLEQVKGVVFRRAQNNDLQSAQTTISSST